MIANYVPFAIARRFVVNRRNRKTSRRIGQEHGNGNTKYLRLREKTAA